MKAKEFATNVGVFYLGVGTMACIVDLAGEGGISLNAFVVFILSLFFILWVRLYG